MLFTQEHLPIFALAPDADRYDSDPATDIVNTKLYGHVTFIVMEGAGGVGATVITVEECDDTTPSNSTAIAFRYAVAQTGNLFTQFAWALAAGYTLIAGANKMVAIEIDAAELSDGFPFVRVQTTESTDGAVDAAIIAFGSLPRYASGILPTALS